MRSFAACTSLLATLCLGGCATTGLRIGIATARSEVGLASHYARRFEGRRTASGEPYDERELTGAHRTLPLGSKVKVTNLLNGRSVMVTINDRGPYMRRREIDLSYGAARVLGMVRRGVARVRIELVES